MFDHSKMTEEQTLKKEASNMRQKQRKEESSPASAPTIEEVHEEVQPYSVRRRVLPDSLIALQSPQGHQYLMDALQQETAAPFLSLLQHSVNQSDPTYCGVSTLVMICNGLDLDPQYRWKGYGWRYYTEECLLSCCWTQERILQQGGINLDEFAELARCQGLQVDTKRPNQYSFDDFCRDVETVMTTKDSKMLVVSFGRAGLHQTGEGHFSPVAAYHKETNQVLICDVARFKYPHYWVRVEDLYSAMQLVDRDTDKPRGWFVVTAPQQDCSGEDRRPAYLVPEVGQPNPCPLHNVKVEYCSARNQRNGDEACR
jgi:glutathione gamma-glutamylcysteinyltransferase